MECGSVRLNLLTQRGTHSGNWQFKAVSKYDMSVYPVYSVIGAHTVITSYNWSGRTVGYVIWWTIEQLTTNCAEWHSFYGMMWCIAYIPYYQTVAVQHHQSSISSLNSSLRLSPGSNNYSRRYLPWFNGLSIISDVIWPMLTSVFGPSFSEYVQDSVTLN